MTDYCTTIAHTASEEHDGGQDERQTVKSDHLTTEHRENMTADEWTKPASVATINNSSAANVVPEAGNKGNRTSEEYTRQMEHLNMQNPYAGFSDARAYYGWLSAGMNPMRFPTLIYPHSFLGFAPTVAWMKTNGDMSGQIATIEKIDRWKGGRKDGGSSSASSISSEVSDNSQDSAMYTKNTKRCSPNTKDISKSIHSDEDEGLVLDERETLKRRQLKEADKLHAQMPRPQPERSSVIQQHTSAQAKPSVITHALAACESSEQEQNKPAKRGRASTRQIEKTEQYWDRRKKNNVSAKKSRDARRQREALMNQRSAMLETENLRLRAELATIRDDNSRLKQELNSLKNTQS